ncbi:hypothetical protein [Pseudomonas phage Achelous]|uniref:Uncharacterized protein n=1 Tax=Pseudomonas phage Achelous TaxID=2163982 RepID=A0A2S1GMT9_9CAUD|nr:hypothetical protein HOT10_gp13 [Pseudomonas phage Achelous]AWD90690.1 hypothetical protein [Pseudomonas phage Achelous]
MARMTVTFEVDQIEEDCDREKLALELIDSLQAQYPYIDINPEHVEVE